MKQLALCELWLPALLEEEPMIGGPCVAGGGLGWMALLVKLLSFIGVCLQTQPVCCTLQASGAPVEVHALVLWFDAEFSGRHSKEAAALLTTSPHAPQTHWAQTVLTLRKPILLQVSW